MRRPENTVSKPPSRARAGNGCIGWICLAILLVGGVALYFRLRPGGAGLPLRLTPAMLQAGLDKAFPVDKREMFLTVHLSDPTVALDANDGDRIGFGAAVGVSSGGRKLANGTVTATGKLRYDADSGVFYLDSPQVKHLDIDRVNSAIATPVRKAVSYLLDKGIRHLPVYQLDPTDPVQKAAKRGIRDVRVKDGAVEVVLGMNQ